jgi:hypothetical protein
MLAPETLQSPWRANNSAALRTPIDHRLNCGISQEPVHYALPECLEAVAERHSNLDITRASPTIRHFTGERRTATLLGRSRLDLCHTGQVGTPLDLGHEVPTMTPDIPRQHLFLIVRHWRFPLNAQTGKLWVVSYQVDIE